MSVIHKESAIHTQKQYLVHNVSKFPQDKNFLIGKKVLVVEINGTTASVKFGAGPRQYIPLRSLFFVQGYEAKSVHAKNADGFVVKCPNEFNIKEGTAYLEPDSVDETHAKFTIEGKELKLPLSILIKLVRKQVKVKDRNVKKEAKESGIPVSVIEAVAGALKVAELVELPSAITKILPNLNVPVLIDQVKSANIEVFDFNGDLHTNIHDAMISNERYIHRMIQKAVINDATQLLNTQFSNIRDNYHE